MHMRILNIAEKPSVAKSIAQTLGGRCSTSSSYKYTPIYEFVYPFQSVSSKYLFTSVLGHLTSTLFPDNNKNWSLSNPIDLFHAPINKLITDNMIPIKNNIERLVHKSDVLVIWTDCDREGEYIGQEIADVVINIKNIPVYRARFSALSRNDIINALDTLCPINKYEVNAVATRIELDLRIGSAYTRLQTLALNNIVGSIVSYGSCQIPTLGFVVDRHDKIIEFVSEYYCSLEFIVDCDNNKYTNNNNNTVDIKYNNSVDIKYNNDYNNNNNINKNIIQDNNKDINSCDVFKWKRGHVYDHDCINQLHSYLISNSNINNSNINNIRGVVIKVEENSVTKYKPLPLKTVEMQKTLCSYLRMGAQKLMSIAESLYTKGYISYPRTETDSFPMSFNHKEIVQSVSSDDVLNGVVVPMKYPRSGKSNDMAHLPIYPIKPGNNLSGDDRSVYEFILRRYVAGLMDNAIGVENNVLIQIKEEMFYKKGLIITQRNYLEMYHYEKWIEIKINEYKEGEYIDIINIKEYTNNNNNRKKGILNISGEFTKAPGYLSETDLIALMDKHGIGTDATIHEHIEKIIKRKYVKKQGSKIIPEGLGISLIRGYHIFNKELSGPKLRAELELELKRIEKGDIECDVVLERQIGVYKQIYSKIAENIEEFKREFVMSSNNDNYRRNNNGHDNDSNDEDDDNDDMGGDKKKYINKKEYKNNKVYKDISNNNKYNNNNKYIGVTKEEDGKVKVIRAYKKTSTKRDLTKNQVSPERKKEILNKTVIRIGNTTKTMNENKKILNCKCKKEAKQFQVQKKNDNHGRVFYSCPDRKCDLFVWEEDVSTFKPMIEKETDIKCDCGYQVKMYVAHSNANNGREYYKCNKSYKPCKYFKWKDEIEGNK